MVTMPLDRVQVIVEHLLTDGSRMGLILGNELNVAMGASARRRAARSARYDWSGWSAETDLDNPDDRAGVYHLTITQNGEEYAVITHRTVGGKYPIDGEVANEKVERAKRIVAALNAATP